MLAVGVEYNLHTLFMGVDKFLEAGGLAEHMPKARVKFC